VHNRVEVHFESVELIVQRVYGEPGDHVECVVHFAFRFPDGRVDSNCAASVWHAIEPVSSGIVDITLPEAYKCPAYGHSLERAIEAYYRPRVGVDGTVIRIGPKGASPLIIGVPMASVACAEFEAESENAA